MATVLQGALQEWRMEQHLACGSSRVWMPGDAVELALGTCHEVYNRQRQTAYSLHVYEPRLESMTFYDRNIAGELEPLRQEGTEQW
jgi:hypothetical protein